jgi:hypothetical protein
MIKDVVVQNGLLGIAAGTLVCMVGHSHERLYSLAEVALLADNPRIIKIVPRERELGPGWPARLSTGCPRNAWGQIWLLFGGDQLP